MPAISADVSTDIVTISLLRHRLDIESVVISHHFCGKHCLKVPGFHLSFLISLEKLIADISHWVWLGCRVEKLMVEILEGTLLPPELQKSEHIGGKRVPVTGLGHLHSCLASRDSIFVNSDIALVNIVEIICW